jgi:hypothetical protein
MKDNELEEALEIISRALCFDYEGIMGENEEKYYRVLFTDFVDEKEKIILEKNLINNNPIEQALKDKQELERFTRLCIEKNVDIPLIKQCNYLNVYNLELCIKDEFLKRQELTEEEFNFAKEMIKKYGK